MSTINTCHPLLLIQERGRRKSDSRRAREGCEFWGAKKMPILGCKEDADFRVPKKGAS
jgi:hypothetical protein